MAIFEMRFTIGGRTVSVPYGAVTIWHNFPGRRAGDPDPAVFGPDPHPWDPGPHPWEIDGSPFVAVEDLGLLAAIDELAARLSPDLRAGVIDAATVARRVAISTLPPGVEYVPLERPRQRGDC